MFKNWFNWLVIIIVIGLFQMVAQLSFYAEYSLFNNDYTIVIIWYEILSFIFILASVLIIIKWFLMSKRIKAFKNMIGFLSSHKPNIMSGIYRWILFKNAR